MASFEVLAGKKIAEPVSLVFSLPQFVKPF
jgi:hypothetical protein